MRNKKMLQLSIILLIFSSLVFMIALGYISDNKYIKEREAYYRKNDIKINQIYTPSHNANSYIKIANGLNTHTKIHINYS